MQNFCWTHMERANGCSGCEESRRQEMEAELIELREQANG